MYINPNTEEHATAYAKRLEDEIDRRKKAALAGAGSGAATGGKKAGAAGAIIGALADRTNTRWGKFRPWILWTSIPLGITSLLAFSTPDFSYKGKFIYAVVTYQSIAAIEAICTGVPAFTEEMTAADSIACNDLSKIETPNYAPKEQVKEWQHWLAYCQYHFREMQSGEAVRIMKDYGLM